MSTGQALGAVTGAVAGFVIGGPTGALYGAQIGMMAGGYLDPPKGPTMEGPRLSDLSVQTSTYGAFIPRVYGTVGINGNVFWLENNKLKEVVKKKKSGGKGGGSSATTKTYTYFATLAVGVCQGPVDGIRRIWAGPNLIYDGGSLDLGSIIAGNKTLAANFSIYLGNDTQLPDSRMQADLGAANTPAYRGLCYVVIKDFALAKYGNAIPAFKFEVLTNGGTTAETLTTTTKTEDLYLGSAMCTGNVRDKNGYSHYVVYRDAGLPVHVMTGYTGASIERTLPLPAYYYSAISGMHCVFDKLQFVYAEKQGPGLYRVFWGNEMHFHSTPHSESLSYFRQFIELSETHVFILLSNGTYTTCHVERVKVDTDDASVKTIALSSGEHPSGVVWGGQLVLFTVASPVITFKTYDAETLDQTGAFTVTIAGISSDYNNYALRRVSLLGDVLTILNGGSGSQVLRINLATLTGSIVNIPSVGPINSTPDSNIQDLGGVIRVAATNYTASDATQSIYTITLARQNIGGEPIAGIITAECEQTGLLSASDIDVSELTDSAFGYRVAKVGSVRQAIEPLQAVWPFDAVQSGYKIKFRPRGSASVAGVTVGDLGVDEQLRQVREMDSQLPNELLGNYIDSGRNYDANQQRWARPSTGAVNARTMELPIVLTATQSAQVLERLGYLYWLERIDFGPFNLPPTFAHLEPADVVTIDAGYAVYELRLTSVNYKSDGSIECMARLNQPSTYTSLAVADDTNDAGLIPNGESSSYLMLDLPVVDDTLQDAPGIGVAMWGNSYDWYGGTLWQSADGGQTWTDIQSFNAPVVSARARSGLSAHAGNILDMGTSLVVDMWSGELFSVTESQMLNGSNVAAYGAHGRWEIIRFMNAVLNADGSYTISGLWRGDKGTEWATGLHAVGDSFVLLDDADLAFVGLSSDLIGAQRDYRGISADADIDSDSSLPFTYLGANLKCLSPCHAKGTRAAGDLTISWQRRTRVGGAWRDIADAQLGEAVEAYEIDIMSGATVKRTITASSKTATYTSAQQVTDFGSAQASIVVRIYQISNIIGRGYPLEVTL